MKADISEFSYGFAVVDELINWHGLHLTAVPIYPSLYEEGQAGVGYDVKLSTPHLPLFLQFKLSHCMIRRNAYECKQGWFRVPFYRMKLRPAHFSNQHQSLLHLESLGNAVFYVAPFFHLPDELNIHYLNRQILSNSVFVRPSDIGPLPDDGQHHVSYENTSYGIFRSEPRKIESAIDYQTFAESVSSAFDEPDKLYVYENYKSLADHMVEILKEQKMRKPIDFRELPERMSPLRQVAYLARTFFDCEFIIVSRKSTPAETERSSL